MGRRRKQNGIELFAALPWPLGIAAGLIGFLSVRHDFIGWMSHQGGPLAQGFNQGMGTLLSRLAWLVLAICWIGAAASFVGAHRRRKLLDTRTDLESLSQGGWRQFELLVGEAFRRQGYALEETGLGGADGGIDSILRRDGRRTLVQCKQWKRQQVGVSVVRKMAGLLAHHHAQAVKVVCMGSYTKDAGRFAHLRQSASCRCWYRPKQRQRLSQPQPTRAEAANRRTAEIFLGCSQLPKCRGTG